MARSGDLHEAVVTLERGRARFLCKALAHSPLNMEKVRAADPQAYDLYYQLTNQLRWLEAGVHPPSPGSTEGVQRLTSSERLKYAEQIWDELHKVMTGIRSIPGYEDFQAKAEFSDIAEAVQSDSPLIYISTLETGSMIIVLHRADNTSDVEVRSVWLDQFTTTTFIDLLVKEKGDASLPGYFFGQLFNSKWVRQSLPKILWKLGERLMAPIAALLRTLGKQSVILIPFGRLALLPLHAATYSVEGSEISFIDEFTTSYALNARSHQVAWQHAMKYENSPYLIGVANPLPSSRPLRAAKFELQEVARLFAEDARDLLYEETATKTAVTSILPKGTYLHFSCHGRFSSGEPLDSHLELGGNDRLSLRDLLHGLGAPLRARLAVLSACQSAVNESLILPDEFLSLPNGFIQAGVPGVLGTLWNVDDLSTALVVIKFYEIHLKASTGSARQAVPAPEALGQAQRWLREIPARDLTVLFDIERRKPDAERTMPYEQASAAWRRFLTMQPDDRPFAHPYYWAAFTFTGV
jgi:CHAT domain-containing protein